MYQRIMVAVDESTTADRALCEALKLAKDQRAQLRLVHVVDEAALCRYGPPLTDVGPLLDAWRQGGQDILRKAASLAQQEGMPAETELLEALGRRVPDLIVDAATRWRADLLVLGTHGRHGFQHLLLGSVAEAVVRISPIPVLLTHGA